MKQKTELMEYLVSEEYIPLLERAISHHYHLLPEQDKRNKHIKAINLMRSFTAESTKNDRSMEF